MKELKLFDYENNNIRTMMIRNEVYFVAKDVAEILGYTNSRKAVGDHVDEEDKGVAKCDTLGGIQDLTVINESGLYSLILSSKLPNAKKIKRWVTSEVLPSIRKHGMYAKDELLDNPDFLLEVATKLKEERAKRLELESQIQTDKPKVQFANSVETSNQSILVGQLAKLIKQSGHNIGQNRLFEWMRNNGYLIKRGHNYNQPTQKSMELGLMEVKERTINNPDGSVRITMTPKVTGKGQIYFVDKFIGKTA